MKPSTSFAMAIAVFGGFNPSLQARFSQEDVRQVDVEHEFTAETYNDKMSYGPPLGWNRLWRTATSGLMMAAGSLSQTRFDYREDIKIRADSETPLHVTFRREKREDAVEKFLEQELRLGWEVGRGTIFAIMADGDGSKEYADLGGSVIQKVAADTFLEGYYWSVDHYYGFKKPFASDRRSRDPYTAGATLHVQPASLTSLFLKAEYDHPLRWDLVNEGYQYEYGRRRVDWDVEISREQTDGWRVSGYAEEKLEGKSWYVTPGSFKKLKRRVWIHDIERFFPWNARPSSVGLMAVWRHASYEQKDLALLPDRFANYDYEKSAHSERREVGSYARSNWSISDNGRHDFIGGVYANALRLSEAKVSRRVEVKLQTGWQYLASANTRVFSSVTWDVDEVSEALFEGRKVRAWGGGNFQVIAAF